MKDGRKIPAEAMAAPAVVSVNVTTTSWTQTSVVVDCPAGWWCSAGSSTPCERGFYNPTVNMDDAGDCTKCPQEEATTAVLGATSSDECRCLAGEFMDAPNDRSEPLSWNCVSCEKTSTDIVCEDDGMFLQDIGVKAGFCA